MPQPDPQPQVSEEAVEAAEEALLRDTEMFDSIGDPMEDFDYVARVALEAAAPAIRKQERQRVREALKGEKAVEAVARRLAAGDGHGHWHLLEQTAPYLRAAKALNEAALDTLEDS